MASMRFYVKVSPRLRSKVYQGMVEGSKETLHYLKSRLRKTEPRHYIDHGGLLSKMLIDNGLEPDSGSLARGWADTITSMTMYSGKNVISWGLFNSRKLNEATPWIGIGAKPKQWTGANREINFKSPSLNPKGSEINFSIGANILINDGAYRPLPSMIPIRTLYQNGISIISPFTWESNPYPNNGYWLLDELGYMGNGIAYHGTGFIRDAYYPIIGIDSSQMLADGKHRFALSQDSWTKLRRNVTYQINKAIH